METSREAISTSSTSVSLRAGIAVRNLRKRFGSFTGTGQRLGGGAGRVADRAAGTERQWQVDVVARHRRPGRAGGGEVVIGDQVATIAAPAAQRRLRLPALRRLQAHDRARQRRLRLAHPQAAQGGDSRSGSTSCCSWCSWTASPSATRPSSPAGSGSGWRWRGRWRSNRGCCCWTSRSVPWMRGCARSCATGCAGCTTRSR